MKRRKKASADPAHLYYSGALLRLFARLVARRHGVRLGEILRDVDAAQRMSVDELQAYRDRKFVALARYCYEHVLYYRRLFRESGLTPDCIRGLDDLRCLPPLTKDTVRKHFNDLLSDGFSSLKPIRHSTGGTTGEPMTVFYDVTTSFVHGACHVRGLAWSGYKMGLPTLSFTGGSLGLGKAGLKLRLADHLYGLHRFPAYEIDRSTARSLLDVCRRKHILYGMGYCSVWLLFCEYLEQDGEHLPLKAIYPTAEPLFPSWADKIQRITDAHVMDYYGCGEVQALGYRPGPDLPHSIPEDHVAIEVLGADGRISSVGEGEFVITDLDNKAFPLIRYRNGDAGVIAYPDSSLALPFRRILRLDGRIGDFFYRTDGSRVSGTLAPHLLQQTGAPVKQFQLCQDEIGSVTFRHAPSPLLTREKRHLIAKILKSLLGEETKVSFEETTDFPLTASGKRRFAICRVKAESRPASPLWQHHGRLKTQDSPEQQRFATPFDPPEAGPHHLERGKTNAAG